MSIKAKKEKVFGDISALRTLVGDFPQLNTNNSFPSIDNKGNPQDFLIDVLKSIVGFEAIREAFIDILTYAIDEIEPKLKDLFKNELKAIVSCGVNPQIPSWFQSGGIGFTIEVKKTDFFNILKINPNTLVGGLIYEDVSSELQSTDMNTFLYNVIQNPGVDHSWSNIITVRFDDVGTPNNTFTIKAHQSYNQRPLDELNNDFVDSINILSSPALLVKILDNIFGALTSLPQVNKAEKQLEMESMIDTIVTDIIESENIDVVFDEGFFELTNDQLNNVKDSAKNRRKGITKLKTCNDIEVSIPFDIVRSTFDALSVTTNTVEDNRNIIETNLNLMATSIANDAASQQDRYSVTLGFFEALFKGLATTFMNAIMSPKIITLFIINYKIVNGTSGFTNSDFIDPIDFMKKNRRLIKMFIETIRDIITEMLLSMALKHIMKLVSQNSIEALKERGNNQIAILLSLVGIPQEVIALIRNNLPITI